MPTTQFKSKKVAFRIQDGVPASADLLGGKGAGLVELAGLGIPVPPGFILPTSVARAYAQHLQVPSRLAHQLNWSIEALERETGKVFGCRQNALLVSVRSGAKFSMPGMMDTVLNLGINPEVAAGLARQYDARFAYDCYRRFLQMFGAVVMGVERRGFEEIIAQVKQRRSIDDDRALDVGALKEVCNRFRILIEKSTGEPVVDDPRRQLELAIIAVLSSWHNPRAVQYRRLNRIPNGLGTAVNVVAMVYGNRDERSGTGVVFSRNVSTGDKGIWGEFMSNAQGEDVVSGVRTPQPVAALRSVMPEVYDRLVAIVDDLDRRRGHAVDIEFTIESGMLYILQVRRAKLSPEAAATIAVHEVWNKTVTKEVAVSRVSKEQIRALRTRTFEPEDLARAIAEGPLGKGLSASPGCASGKVVFTSKAAVEAAKRNEQVILVRPDTSPDDLPGMIAATAIVTMSGGYTSHAAVVARDLGKPCVVSAKLPVCEGEIVSVDGQTGLIFSGEVQLTGSRNKKEVNLFLKWADAEEAKKWPKPRLVFEHFVRQRSVHAMIADFYLADAMARRAEGTRLEAEARAARLRVHCEVAECLAMYLVVAVGGELRHSKKEWIQTSNELKTLCGKFCTALGGGRKDAQLMTVRRLETVEVQEQIQYLELVVSVFRRGQWSPLLGGHRWADIAEAALFFLKGEWSHSLFADHAFDLQHNNGCVFGKNKMIMGEFGSPLGRQLEEKKNADASVRGLHRRMMPFISADTPLDPIVEQLYKKGELLGVWN